MKRAYEWKILLRIVLLPVSFGLLGWLLWHGHTTFCVFLVPFILYQLIDIFHYQRKVYTELEQFTEAIHYRDFSRHFDVSKAPAELQPLRKSFNNLTNSFKQISKEKEVQYQYLQQILEIVGTGIISFEVGEGNVAWMNDAFKKMLNLRHKKGAFTDAREDRMGRFEAANTGTLFLDEIGNISLQQQAKLLSVLQNRQVNRLGANQPIEIDIRLICATNVPMTDLANESRFRKDLIYRINTVEIMVPPLRNRSEDIILLAEHFSKVYAQKYMKPAFEFDKRAIEKLLNYSFPGNVRELQYAIERAVIMADDSVLQAKDLLFSPIEQAFNIPVVIETNLNDLEKSTIMRVIEKNNGNISKASKELGLTRTALYRRLNKYDI